MSFYCIPHSIVMHGAMLDGLSDGGKIHSVKGKCGQAYCMRNLCMFFFSFSCEMQHVISLVMESHTQKWPLF